MNRVKTGHSGFKLLFSALLAFIFLLHSEQLLALEVSASVDRPQLTLEDTVTLSVKVAGARQASPPQLPPLPDFDIQPMGTQTSVQIVNGNTTESVIFNYQMTPQKEGTFTLDGIQLQVKGKTYRASPLTLTVLPPASTNLPADQLEVFAEAEVSNSNPYLQEQVRLSYRLYHRVPVRNVQLDPPLEHFRKIPLGQPVQFTRRVDGQDFHVYEFNYALFPMREGDFEIPPARFQVDVVKRDKNRPGPFDRFNLPHQFDPLFSDPFFSGGQRLVRKNLVTQAIKGSVNPFPAENQPADFKGLVGQFEIRQDINKRALETGDTATLTISLSGNGNLSSVSLPVLPDIPGLKVYEDQPQIEEQVSGNELRAEKKFILALVPGEAGQFRFPKLKIPYFDPKREQYAHLSTGEVQLEVRGSKVAQSPGLVQKNSTRPPSTQGEGPEILPIHIRREQFQDHSPTQWATWLVGFLLPPLGYFAFAAWYRKKVRLKQDQAYRRLSLAHGKAMTHLNDLDPDLDPREKARRVSSLVRDYIGDKLNLQGTALTPEEVRTLLQTQGFGPSDITPVDEFLSRCEAMEFAAVGTGGEEDLTHSARDIIGHLEQRL